MKIFLGTDHAGFALKETIKEYLVSLGHAVEDLGAHVFAKEDDYPDFVVPVARATALSSGARGIIFGRTGEGEAMAANRVAGARAAVYYGGAREVVTLSRQHNDANILSLGAGFLSDDEAKEVVMMWLDTPFSGEERHIRRNHKLDTPL